MFDGPWDSCMLIRGLDPSACASWVQAWGSISALLIAIFLAWYQQHVSQKALRQQAHKDRLASHEAFIEISNVALETLTQQIENIFPFAPDRNQFSDARTYVQYDYAPNRVESHLSELAIISVATLRSAQSIRAAIALREELQHCQAMTRATALLTTGEYGEWAFRGVDAAVSLKRAQERLAELREARIALTSP